MLESMYEDHGDTLALQYGGSQLIHRYVKSTFWRAIYNGNYKSSYKNYNRNDFKFHTPNHIKNIVAQNFTQELEFYEFCKQRFQKQLLAIQ